MKKSELKELIKEVRQELREAEDKKPEDYGITKYNWNSKGELDVNQDVNLDYQQFKKFPFNFGTVKGNFYCNNNKLTSLIGAPKVINGDFNCVGNNLTSLQYAPQKVNGGFYCAANKLTSLEGAPQKVGDNFDCGENKLTNLEGAPKEISGHFDCSWNKLNSLVGAPQKINKWFNCRGNPGKFTEEDVREVCNVKGNIIV